MAELHKNRDIAQRQNAGSVFPMKETKKHAYCVPPFWRFSRVLLLAPGLPTT